MRRLVGILIGLVVLSPFLGWATVRVVQFVQFDRAVTGHLKRAADANTVELAEKELVGVVTYLQQNGVTSGYTTAMFYTEPDEDVGFWYSNLSASLEELRKVPQGATQLEKSNILIKLRETLVDHGQGVTVTVPPGASIFPRNTLYFLWGWISGGMLVIVGVSVGMYITIRSIRS